MNLFSLFLLAFSAFFNLWFYLKTPSKIDCPLVKKMVYFNPQNLSFPQQLHPDFSPELKLLTATQKDELIESSMVKKEHQLQDSYLIFTIVIGIMSISVELVLAKNARMIKKNNQSLLLNNEIIIKQNAELQHTLVAMEESKEENSRALQIIAHDLRSPMAAIVGLSGFMIDEHHLTKDDMEVINLIYTSGVDSLKFINEVLDQGSTKMEMKKEAVDLHQLLTYCIAQFKYKAHEKSQEIKFEGATTLKLELNREKIWRVINNLISNALKFSPHQSTVTVALNLANEKAIISVKDRGIGIPESLGDKIFGMNAQRKREGTAGEKSFGMGLSIAKQNIEAHGGTLSFVSGTGKGTTFFVELPICS